MFHALMARLRRWRIVDNTTAFQVAIAPGIGLCFVGFYLYDWARRRRRRRRRDEDD